MGGQSRRGRSTLAHGSLCRDGIDRWDPLERGCRSTSRPCCGPAHQLFVLEPERASRSQLAVHITDERNGLLRCGLLQYSDADELAVLPPSAVASAGPNGGNRYRKCDDLKSVTDSDNPGHPGLHQPCNRRACTLGLTTPVRSCVRSRLAVGPGRACARTECRRVSVREPLERCLLSYQTFLRTAVTTRSTRSTSTRTAS